MLDIRRCERCERKSTSRGILIIVQKSGKCSNITGACWEKIGGHLWYHLSLNHTLDYKKVPLFDKWGGGWGPLKHTWLQKYAAFWQKQNWLSISAEGGKGPLKHTWLQKYAAFWQKQNWLSISAEGGIFRLNKTVMLLKFDMLPNILKLRIFLITSLQDFRILKTFHAFARTGIWTKKQS